MKPTNCLKLFFFFICSIFALQIKAQDLPDGFYIKDVAAGWNEPVGVAFNKSGTQMYVWEKSGKVFVCTWNAATKNYRKQTVAVLDISPEVGNWRDHGLLGFALDPKFDRNGYIYLLYVVDRHYLMNFGTSNYHVTSNDYYSATIGRITKYKVITNSNNQIVADLSSRKILLGETKSTGIPVLYESHGMGSLAFAADGTLLASTGDAGSYNTMDNGSLAETYYLQALSDGIITPNENVGAFRAQLLTSLNGKILRINPQNGNGVTSNPFYSATQPRSAKSRIWAMGFRNPFRFTIKPNSGSLDSSTGDIGEIYEGDVGWYTYEELNIIHEPASNCGWPIFEGLTPMDWYAGSLTENKDVPNPLYSIGGCTQRYFNFQDLIKQATADNIHTVYNPCNTSVPIKGGNNTHFFHHVPSLDWKHDVDSARVKIFNGNILHVAQIGTAASGVDGTPFRGNCAVAGCWYTGNMFPAKYKNTFFFGDYAAGWIKNATIQYTDEVKSVESFSNVFGNVVCIAEDPVDGSLVCVDIGTNTIRRILFGGNQPPVAKINANKFYGVSPLKIKLDALQSYDPEGGSLTYAWNFNDGSTANGGVKQTHTFTGTANQPKKFVVRLTVTDSAGAKAEDSMIVSVNNTPPVVNIISPIKNSEYKIGTDTTYTLQATVTDAEHSPSQLFYQWQTILRHDNHEHPEAIDTNKITSSVVSRIGCNGDTYYWLFNLTVTDAAGLSAKDSCKIFPKCGSPLPLNTMQQSVSAGNEKTIPENEIKISPNPFQNTFVLNAFFTKSQTVTLNITNMHFQLVKTQTLTAKTGTNNFVIGNLERLPAGMYVVEIISKEGITRKKEIIKLK